MRELLIAGSSTVIPSNLPPPHSRRHNRHRRRGRAPIPTKLPPSKIPPLPPPPPPSPAAAPSSRPLLTAVRLDAAGRLKYYAYLASKLAGEGRLEHFSMIAESVTAASGLDPRRFVSLLSFELISAGISREIQIPGKLRSVVDILARVEKFGISPLVLLDGVARESLAGECRCIVDFGDVEEAVSVMEILAGFGYPVKELVDPLLVIKTCVGKCKPDTVLRYAFILPHAHIILCIIIHEFGKKKDFSSSLKVFKAFKKKLERPNMYAYRVIIDVCGNCGESVRSRQIYEELLAENIIPNVFVFNSLMNANAHDLNYVLHVYQQMKDLGVTPDVASYNILLKACRLSGKVNIAQEIYQDGQHAELTGELKLDVFTYSTITKVLADRKMWQAALQIKEDMVLAGVTPNMVTWSSLISACANAGLVEKAFQLFNEMLLAGFQPNSQCCNILLHACIEAHQYDRAFRLFNLWKTSGSKEAYGESGNGNRDPVVRLNHIDDGNKIITDTESKSYYPGFARVFPFVPTTSTYNTLMKACGTDTYRAKVLMDEMKRMDLSPNQVSWSILIDTCGGSGNVQGVAQILRTMHEAGIKPDVVAYTTAIKVYVENKNINGAFSLYTEMRRSGVRPNLVTYNTLLRARSRYGSLHEVQQCLGIYQDMRKAGYKSNDYYLKELIEEWCEGVIQDNNRNEHQTRSVRRADSGRSQSLVLEKVTVHLQKSVAESLVIDVQGLTQVEARIVVLAALRMLRENYALGKLLDDDILIIFGAKESTIDNGTRGNEVKGTIVKLLQNELGLEVLLAGTHLRSNDIRHLRGGLDSDRDSKQSSGTTRLSVELKSSARRPTVLERLKVPKSSLHQWLKRRECG